MTDMEYNRTSPFISNSLHYSSEIYPYVGEFSYILYTFGTDFRHNYFDCDKKVTICTKFVFFRRIKVLKIWTSKRYSLSMTRT